MKRARRLARELILYLVFGSVTLVVLTVLAALILWPIMWREGRMG